MNEKVNDSISHDDAERAALAVRSVDLYGADVTATRPEFTVANLIRRSGLHMLWAQPGAKTHTLLYIVHVLMLEALPPLLFEHPLLAVNRGYKRVLWIATEETAGILRWKAETVLRGLDAARIAGELRFIWASDPNCRTTLDDLPAILDTEGPFDAVVLDSLTGLRPKTVNSERIKWDLDNDAANEMCLTLRGIGTSRSTDLFLAHHTGRDISKGYRGPTDWWASVDVMFGLIPDGEKIRVKPEKNRDGILLKPFLLTPSWEPDSFRLAYSGSAPTVALTEKAQEADAYLRRKGAASQAEIQKAVPIARSTMQDVKRQCVDAGLWQPSGEKHGRSPVYIHTGAGK